MKNLRTTSRYSKSLMYLAIEQKKLDVIHQDMLVVQEVLNNSPDLGLLLKSPIVKSDKKTTILIKIFDGKIDALLLDFFKILVKKRREALLEDIIEVFINQYNQHEGIERVRVTSAVALSEENRKIILENIKKEIGEKIELEEEVDAAIIGGIIIRNNDLQYDQSIRKKLKGIEKQLTS